MESLAGEQISKCHSGAKLASFEFKAIGNSRIGRYLQYRCRHFISSFNNNNSILFGKVKI